MRSGRGVHYFASGDKYDGEWMNNLCHGEGIYTTSAGHFYCGSWRSGKVNFTIIFIVFCFLIIFLNSLDAWIWFTCYS